MAIYSFSADVFSRSKGHRATAASAYRSASLIEDHTTGERFDYTRKRGVLYSEILAPDNAPAWMRDRQELWNRVEAQEKRSDSQLAREILLALPHELDESDRLALVRDFIREEFVARGMVADLSIHEPSAAGDERNTHAHVMLTLRTIEGDGFGKKARDWNRDELLTHWREAWAAHCNTALSEAGFDDVRVDHRSLEDQGIDRIPGAHKGKATTAQERRGKTTPRSDRGEDIARDNKELSQLVDELAAIDKELAEHEERQLDELYGPAEDEPSPFEAGISASQEPDAPTRSATGEREQLHEFATPFISDVTQDGEIHIEDGLSWWQRAVHVFSQARDSALSWARDSWQSARDAFRGDPEIEDDGPELGR